MNTIFERMKAGELISPEDPEYGMLYTAILKAIDIVGEINTPAHKSLEEIHSLMCRLTGKEIDSSVRVVPPFHTNFGQFIEFGRNVFVNSNCTFMDEGGIVIEDNVFIGPNVTLVTQNHAESPVLRNHTYAKAITIRRGAWIGAGALVLPGISVGENAIVGAGSVVTKDIPQNTIVAGNPARFIREIKNGQ